MKSLVLYKFMANSTLIHVVNTNLTSDEEEFDRDEK